MQFKITIITGILFLLIGSISIAKPISKNETNPQKIEQTRKKKPNFIQKIILKKIQNKIYHDGEKASSLSKLSLALGIASFVSAFIGIGFLAALTAIITGAMVLKREDLKEKSRSYAIAGIVLGATLIFLATLFIGAYFYFGWG